MRSRHQVDISTRFTAVGLPPTREIGGVAIIREPYIADEGLEDAVNLAIALGRPLLLQGDPGTGKTRLAHAVAYALGLPLEEAYIKSTSRAQDLLYSYDAVQRLYDVQIPQIPPPPGTQTARVSAAGTGPHLTGHPAPSANDSGDALGELPSGGMGQAASDWTTSNSSDTERYVRLGPLGRAIRRAAEHEWRSVVLIDEVDKADIDFPNDLLHELDELAFDIPEVPGLGYAVPEDKPELRPVVIVTNNEEKTLPSAFLRRCVFHYIEFPEDPGEIAAILALHGIDNEVLCEEAVDVLLDMRKLDLSKKPGLSELLDWAGYLHAVKVPVEELASVPYLGALIKQRSDEVRVREQLASR
jgi:MoxR-like ATPase